MAGEPIYRVQRMAAEAAYAQEVTNVVRRLLGRPVTKIAKIAELEVLAKYGVPESFATWGVNPNK